MHHLVQHRISKIRNEGVLLIVRERKVERTSLRHFLEMIMPGRRPTRVIQIDDLTRIALERWGHRQKTPVGLVRRARAMLPLEQGDTYVHTAKYVGLTEYHIRKWAKRFCEYGVSGLCEKPRSGRPPVFAPEVALHVVKLACGRPDHTGSSLS